MGMAPAYLLDLSGTAIGEGKVEMNKMVKGSIAGAAGVALLMGGFGTFALWTDTQGLPAGSITAGHLEIVSAPDADWTDQNGAFDPTIDKIVPGDTITMTQPLEVRAEGKNLKAELAVNVPGYTWGITQLAVVDLNFNGVEPEALSGGRWGFRFDTPAEIAALDGTANLVAKFTFKDVPTQGITDQDKTVSINATTLTLSQVTG